jgi:hypothetical protein
VSFVAPTTAVALDKCKAKQAKDGTLAVSARDVVGSLRFGYTEDWIVTPMSVDVSGDACILDGTAKDCVLGAEGSEARTTPPPYCELHLEDSEGSCTVEIKRCAEGLRAACPPDMVRMGAKCVERIRNVAEEWGTAVDTCHQRGRSLCSVSDMMTCDTLNLGNGTTNTCGTLTDTSSSVWTVTSNSESGQNVFSRPVRYGGDNTIDEQATSTGGMYVFFCCGALGTP